MAQIIKIGFGGGCHWCTEAVFQSLKGVVLVKQGFIASEGENTSFSEAVIVHFDDTAIALRDLVEIHLHTHSCTARHSMRSKYRSAVYFYSTDQREFVISILSQLQSDFDKPLITEILPFHAFKPSDAQFSDYYLKNPQKPFCKSYITPKLRSLLDRFSGLVNNDKIILPAVTS